ncbi:hypothetical protein [Natrialba chahannaoensis]|uniref:hypothetical protein n=1 Tax=Natrialba chahannaoensis TaxID=68911 RepID=UPI00187DA516|nr:hypothetical protein [Natrialba chahannaoensis]
MAKNFVRFVERAEDVLEVGTGRLGDRTSLSGEDDRCIDDAVSKSWTAVWNAFALLEPPVDTSRVRSGSMPSLWTSVVETNFCSAHGRGAGM